MALEEAVVAIQATLAPAFLLTGTGVFLNFLQARYFRAIDRMRALAKELPGASDTHVAALRQRIAHLRTRGRWMRNAILLGVTTLFLTALTAFLLISTVAFSFPVPVRLPILTFAVGLGTFVGALLLAVRDTTLSYRTVEAELDDALR